MADLVSSVRIPDLLERLLIGEYQVPLFQREFVWSTSDIEQFLLSVIDSRPVGMMTIWEQVDGSGLELEHISLPDNDSNGNTQIFFGDPSKKQTNIMQFLMEDNEAQP